MRFEILTDNADTLVLVVDNTIELVTEDLDDIIAIIRDKTGHFEQKVQEPEKEYTEDDLRNLFKL